MSTQNFKPDKYDFYIKLMEVCLKNSENLLRDSLILRSNSSFGSAYSIAVLGFEELAKYWFVFGLFIGWNKETDEEASLLQTRHVYKEHLSWQTLHFYILGQWFEETQYKAEYKELWNRYLKKELSLKAYQRKFRKLLKLESESSFLAKALLELDDIIKKLQIDPKIMDSRRNQGFYVEFDLNKREIVSTPDSFIYEDTIFVDTFDFFLNFSKDLFHTFKNNLKRKKVQEFIDGYRKFSETFRSLDESFKSDTSSSP